ncbi:hypothetical protein [Paenibacillus lemnae]|uniref:Uncharacterized protein n=1 Tax=Paenibacillus lemnae TaxID=1330551 RepID=A0A848M651_PAELE|nr:hypothetical protein [Paenibacillus lemnae]NMO96447.1 hypothetical protein [Paenibacillus lemnae]
MKLSSKKRKLAVSIILLFIIAYVGVGVWIANDTKTILEKAMSGQADHTEYMNDATYQTIHPAERGATSNYAYEGSVHDIGLVFPLHFFVVSKVFTSQTYAHTDFAFKEPVKLTLKLKSGHWYGVGAHIKP